MPKLQAFLTETSTASRDCTGRRQGPLDRGTMRLGGVRFAAPLALLMASCTSVQGTIASATFGKSHCTATITGKTVLEVSLLSGSSNAGIVFTLGQTNGQGALELPSVGSFKVGPAMFFPGFMASAFPANAKFVSAEFDSFPTTEEAMEGSFVLQSVAPEEGGGVGGTFDLVFPHGHVTGSFYGDITSQ